jgi:DNA modification methylase
MDFTCFLADEGDLVLDPFAGSNTTREACEERTRNWLPLRKHQAHHRLSGNRRRRQ